MTGEKTKLDFRTSPKDFSRRSGKLNFCMYALLGISLLKNSLAVEMFNLLTINNLVFISKSAYSQGRYKIQAKFYRAWNDLLLDLVYGFSSGLSDGAEGGLDLKQWRGYFLEAVDGTSLVLPQTKELAAYFGLHKNGTKSGLVETVMAKCLVRADLLNGYVLQTEVFKTTHSELSECRRWLWRLGRRSITIFDRGFAQAAIFAYLVRTDKPFVCRLKVGFNKVVQAFMAGGQTDGEVEFEVYKAEVFANQSAGGQNTGDPGVETIPDTCIGKGERVKLRLVKVLLPTGGIEVLATNLMDTTAITGSDLGELYGKRWGVETVIDSLKNQLLMAVFSGLKPVAVLQDIYATIFVYNLRQLLVNEAQEIINDRAARGKQCGYEQKVNKNVALGVLKPKIITLFLACKPKQIIEELLLFFAQNKIPVVPGKPIPKRQKSLAKRRNLVIQKNYRKAI